MTQTDSKVKYNLHLKLIYRICFDLFETERIRILMLHYFTTQLYTESASTVLEDLLNGKEEYNKLWTEYERPGKQSRSSEHSFKWALLTCVGVNLEPRKRPSR